MTFEGGQLMVIGGGFILWHDPVFPHRYHLEGKQNMIDKAVQPTAGGSYTRDKETGTLNKTAAPKPSPKNKGSLINAAKARKKQGNPIWIAENQPAQLRRFSSVPNKGSSVLLPA